METRFAAVGEQFEDRLALGAADIAHFATLSHDQNPLHHDEARARASRFGGLIASGPHLTSVLMGMTATHFARKAAPLGLEFAFQLRKAARAGDTLRLRWTVVRVEPKARLHGELVFLEGEARNQADELIVSGRATLLVSERA